MTIVSLAYKLWCTGLNLSGKVVSYTAGVHYSKYFRVFFRYSKDTNKLKVLYSTLKSPLNILGVYGLDVRGRVDSRTYGLTGSNYRYLPLTVLPPSRIMFL